MKLRPAMKAVHRKAVAGVALAALLGAGSALAAVGDTVAYSFDLPATGAQNPPYPSVALLTLTETEEGVQFELSPQWTESSGFSSASFIERLDYVYSGPDLSASDFSFVSGAPVSSFSFETNPNNMDTGYQAGDAHIVVNWASQNDASRFDADYDSSTWLVSGAELTNFTGTSASAASQNKPSPVFGVISVTGYSLDGPQPTPSNWVSGVTPIPEPQTYALMFAGLGALAFLRRRRIS